MTAELWREFRDQKKPAAVRQLAKKLATGREGAKKERPEKGQGPQRLKQLEEEVAKLKAALDKRLGELKELQRKLDRSPRSAQDGGAGANCRQRLVRPMCSACFFPWDCFVTYFRLLSSHTVQAFRLGRRPFWE